VGAAVVFARTSAEEVRAKGISAFLVPLDTPGVIRERFNDMGTVAVGRGLLHFEDARISENHLLGEEREGFSQVMQGFDFSRALNGPDHEADHRPPARWACLCTLEGGRLPGAPEDFDGSRSEDQVEGMSAFLEKRETRFTGH
jgi:hypothetical protein